MKVRKAWLNLVKETIIDPDRPIVDPHHHFWKNREQFPPYGLNDFWADTGSGHRVERTVFIECGAEYRTDGPQSMRPVGETEFAVALAAQSHASGSDAKVCAIVAHADLSLGKVVEGVLEAQIEAGKGLLRGIRHHAVWDASPDVPNSRINPPRFLYRQSGFREAIACLARFDLSYDAWIYHPQIPELIELAYACPDTSIILNHLGGPIGVGPYANQRDEIFEHWKHSLSKLSRCPNVTVKLGGLTMPVNGFVWHKRKRPPTSDEIVQAQKSYYLYTIDCFGPERCMFESNFPIEKESVSYHVIWNAFKKMAAGFSESEKNALLAGTATRVYRLD